MTTNWAAASQATGEPTPHSAGTGETFVVGGLTASTVYYFGLETADEVPNWSAISNSPSGTTSAASSSNEWTQQGHDAQHTSYTDQVVNLPWRWKWAWNGPDASGGVSSGKTTLPRNVQPVTGGGKVYVARGTGGVYALNQSDGSVSWNVSPGGSIDSTAAYDADTSCVFVTSSNGYLYKLNVSNGGTAGSFNAGSAISTPPCVISDRVFVSAGNNVYAVNKSSMSQIWSYAAGSAVSTPAAYSPSRDRVIVCTADLYVHAINNNGGGQAWHVKPSPRTGTSDITFANGWPVIAKVHGYVLVKMRLDWNTLWTWSPWPTDNATIRSNLTGTPDQQALYCLDLDDGSIPFICNIGDGGYGDGGYLPMGPQPAVRKFTDNTETVFTMIRGKSGTSVDGRWDTNYGEMVLDGTTISGLSAGYIRWINYNGADNVGGSPTPTDEQPNISMAGDFLFGGHWMAGEMLQITDRSSSLGSFANPITSGNFRSIVTSSNTGSFSSTHYTSGNPTQDGNVRSFPGPGWYIFWNQGTIYDSYWSEYAAWTISNNYVFFRSNDGSIVAFENGNPNTSIQPVRGGPAYASGTFDPMKALDPSPFRQCFTSRPVTVSYLQARQYAGQTVTVEGTIRYVFNNGKSVLLGFSVPHFGTFKVQIRKERLGQLPRSEHPDGPQPGRAVQGRPDHPRHREDRVLPGQPGHLRPVAGPHRPARDVRRPARRQPKPQLAPRDAF